MNFIFKKCPNCGHRLIVNSIDCTHCETQNVDDWAHAFVVVTLLILLLVIAFILFKNF